MKVIISFCILGALAVGWCLGMGTYQDFCVKPQYIVIERTVEKIVFEYKTLEKVVYQDRTVYITDYVHNPRIFHDLEELRLFVKGSYTEIHQLGNQEWNGCVEWALGWQRYALDKGYIISTRNEIDGDTGHVSLLAWTEDGYCYYWDIHSTVIKRGAIKG